jgi:acetyl-CoA acetyltransferase
MSLRGKTAIVGLGVTPMGKVYGKSPTAFAADAIGLALDDAGLEKSDIDGLLVNENMSPEMGPRLQMALGFGELKLMNAMNAYGSTAGMMVAFAGMAIEAGMASCVGGVLAVAAFPQNGWAGGALGRAGAQVRGMDSLRPAYGEYGANTGYALAAQRHMHLYGTTSEQLGQVAVSQRQWAMKNPWAQMRKPMTLEDHQASRYIVEPLHLFDCCLVSNGGVAVIVTSAERARELRQPPAYVLGVGQAAPGDNQRAGHEPAVHTGAKTSGRTALGMAGLTVDDVDVCEIYDCYTYTVLVTLEDYGFCEKGDGGAFVEDGKLGPGGSLPTNTGGGQLSAYYMWGMTPMSEAVVQVRGQGGERQVDEHDVVLVSGNGGILNYHSTTILGAHAD